jgi:hypothetical protein
MNAGTNCLTCELALPAGRLFTQRTGLFLETRNSAAQLRLAVAAAYSR